MVNLSGRGDKDVHTAGDYFGILDEERCVSRIGVAFEKARAEGRALLVGCMPAGFPTVDGQHRRDDRRWSRPASTSSRWSSRTPTR